MFSNLIIYCLSIYFFFHLFGRSDIAASLRCGLNKILPSGILYIGQCAFCFTFWVGLVVSVVISFFAGLVFIPYFLFAAPVLNLILDLVVRALLSYNASDVRPSTYTLFSNTFCGESDISTMKSDGYYGSSTDFTVSTNPEEKKKEDQEKTL